MSTINIKLPESVRERLEHFAQKDGVTIDDFVSTVLTQRVAVADAASYVERRAKKGNPERLQELLSKAPSVEPEQHDRIF